MSEDEQLQKPTAGVSIVGISAKLQWQTFFIPDINRLEEQSNTELRVDFRNIRMINSKFGLGYNIFSSVFMNGFFKSGGLGSIAAGPVLRFYPLESKRWQPYLQCGFIAGYNLALADAIGFVDVNGIRYRTKLRGGLNYKVSNAFGIFFEIGPTWEYSDSFQLDSRSLQVDIGIELFRF